MAIPVGNDRTRFDRLLKDRQKERDNVSGGWRFTVFGDLDVVIQPGLLTYEQRRHIREITGESIEALGQEMGESVGVDTMTAVIWCGLFQQQGGDAPTIEQVAELVSTMSAADIGEVELFDADGNTVTPEDVEEQTTVARTEAAAKAGGIDMTDPKGSESNSITSGLSLPLNMESAPTILAS